MRADIVPFPPDRWHVPIHARAFWIGCRVTGCRQMFGADTVEEMDAEHEAHLMAEHGVRRPEPKDAA